MFQVITSTLFCHFKALGHFALRQNCCDFNLWTLRLSFLTLFSRAIHDLIISVYLIVLGLYLVVIGLINKLLLIASPHIAFLLHMNAGMENNLHKRQCQHFCHVGACHSFFDGNQHLRLLFFCLYQDIFQPFCQESLLLQASSVYENITEWPDPKKTTITKTTQVSFYFDIVDYSFILHLDLMGYFLL